MYDVICRGSRHGSLPGSLGYKVSFSGASAPPTSIGSRVSILCTRQHRFGALLGHHIGLWTVFGVGSLLPATRCDPAVGGETTLDWLRTLPKACKHALHTQWASMGLYKVAQGCLDLTLDRPRDGGWGRVGSGHVTHPPKGPDLAQSHALGCALMQHALLWPVSTCKVAGQLIHGSLDRPRRGGSGVPGHVTDPSKNAQAHRAHRAHAVYGYIPFRAPCTRWHACIGHVTPWWPTGHVATPGRACRHMHA